MFGPKFFKTRMDAMDMFYNIKNNLRNICTKIDICLFLQGIDQTKIDIMKYSEVERKLKKGGCYWVKDGKKHPKWYSPVTGKYFELSYHRSEEVKPGTLNSISKISGVKL